MKKQLLIFIMMLLPMVTWADLQEISGYCGKNGENIKWTVNTGAGTLVFEGSGEMANYNSIGELPWMAYKDRIISISVGEGITSITNKAFYNMNCELITLPTSLESLGASVFQNCKQLKQIELPDNIISIGEAAFSGSAIESIIFSDGIKNLPTNLCYGCDKLIEAILPTELTEIGDYAFSGCSLLSSVTFPTLLVSIGRNAFTNCSNLTEVSLPANLKNIGREAFENAGLLSITIPASISLLENNTFNNCKKLEVVNLNEGISSIGRFCFDNCISLKTLTLPSSLSRLNIYAFSDCTALEEVTVEGANTYLGDYAFYGCSSLVNVTLPEGFSDGCIGNNVFGGCEALAPLYNSTTFFYMSNNGVDFYTIPEGITTIAKYAFKGNETIKHLQLPSTINKFGDYAFSMSKIEELDLSNLDYLVLGAGCFSNSAITNFISPTKIANCPQYAFEGCKNMTELDLTGIMKVPGWIYFGNLGIGNHAFMNCENLKSISLPESVGRLDIGENAFQNCTSLKTFDFSNIDIIARSAFLNCKNLKKVVISDFGKNQIGIGLNPYCFAGCTSLDSVVIGSSGCQSFYMCAFEGCDNLKSIIINAESVPKINDLYYSPYNGLIYEGFSAYNLPFDNTIFTMYGYLADECIQGNDQNFWKKVQFNKIYETLSGDCGDKGNNVTWLLNTEDGILYISGSGNMKMPDDENVLTWKDRSSAIKQVVLSDDIESICSNAFSGCSIKSITLNKHLKSIGDYAFSMSKIENVIFNDELTSIGNWAFGNCDCLQNIEIGSSVQTMGFSVFSYCKNLLSVVFPSNLKTIGQATFNQCDNLKSVVLPKRLARVPEYTFGGCRNLIDIYCPAIVPPRTTGYGNDQIRRNNIIMHIPEGAIDAYKSQSLWGMYQMDEYYAYVNVINNGGGTVVIGEDSLIAGKWDDYLTMGDSFEVQLIPNDYYDVRNFIVNGADASGNLVNNVLSFDYLQESKNIQVAFTPKRFLLSVDIQGRGHVHVLGYDIEIGGKIEVTHDNEIEISAIPNEGYKLSKALLDDSDITSQVEGGNAIYNPTQDMNLKVIFSKETFKLTYMIGDEIYQETEYEFEAVITPEAEPTKEGFTFSGWSEIPETMPAHDVTVTGSFTINKYKLKYTIDDEEYKTYEIEYGTTINPEADPTKEGYTFSGWSEIPETMPAHDVTVTGSFTINQYQVTYVVDGDIFKTELIDYASVITPPSVPEKEGYSFAWNEYPETMPANDITITGQYTINSYKLFYVVDGAEYKSFDVVYNTAITPEADPTKEGYTFSGWSEIPETMPAHDVTVTGSFTINQYQVTYIVDGEIFKTEYVEYASEITPPSVPEREGYSFAWNEYPETMPANDITITGQYTINSYKLFYVVDGVEYKCYDIVYNTTITPEANPTKEGYTFSGWSEIPETMPAHDVTVTGSFSINSYKLTYMIDDKVYKETMYEYGATITPEPQPEGDYATFEWTGLPENMPAHDVVVHASYTTEIIEVLMASQRNIRIYSPNGKKLNKLQKGLNIVVLDDGTVKRVVVK